MRAIVQAHRRPATTSFTTSAAMVFALVTSSCGGAVVGPGQGSGGGADGTDAGSDALASGSDSGAPHLLSDDPTCPHDVPTPPTWPNPGSPAIGGTSCSGTTACEYGVSSANPACNTVVGCVTRRSSCSSVDDCNQSMHDRVWSVTSSPDPATCKAAVAPIDPGGRCPKSRPPIGGACSEEGLSCAYSCAWSTSLCSGGYWVFGSSPPCGGTQ